jgi:NAD(P)H-hydrate epimerase
MKVVSSAQMRELDRRTIEEFDVPGEELMRRAGEGVAHILRSLAAMSGCSRPVVHVLAGRGNNGGDGFVVARLLKEEGVDVTVWLAADPDTIQGDARTHFVRMKSAGVPLNVLPTLQDWESLQAGGLGGDFLVDGILGIGISGPPRGPAAGAISCINAFSDRSVVISIDVPSGLDADSGAAPGAVVRADVTATMGLPKAGLIQPAAVEWVGSIEVIDIGLPDELIRGVSSPVEMIAAADLLGLMPRRRRAAHKGDFGRVLILGGSSAFPGAAALAVRAAVRSGVGLVTALVPEPVAGVAASAEPGAMVRAARATPEGSLLASCLEDAGLRLADYDAILIGPGLTLHPESARLVQRVLDDGSQPLVLDADALTLCAQQPDLLQQSRHPRVLTPHPGEMARLRGCAVSGVQSDRFRVAAEESARFGATVVLKGAGTLVAHAGRPLAVNATGNPGMARGGMGDVLAGFLAGLAAQGLDLYDASRVAVYAHGRAGDCASWRLSQVGMSVDDLIDELPFAMKEVAPR